MLFKPFKIYYQVWGDRSLAVHLCGRHEDGTRGNYILKGTEPYFFVPEDELQFVPHDVRAIRTEYNAAVTLDGRACRKFVMRYPFEVPEARKAFPETFEADVTFDNRIRYDHKIRNLIDIPHGKRELVSSDIKAMPFDHPVKVKPRVCVIDIEVFDKGAFSEPKYPTAPVVSIAAWDSFTDKYVCIFNGKLADTDKRNAAQFFQEEGLKVQVIEAPDEASVFQYFTKFLQTIQPDILCGWNSGMGKGTGYDFPYLENRGKNQNFMVPNWKEYAMFDLMDAYERVHEGEVESKALQFVSTKLGLKGKQSGGMRIWQMLEHDRGQLVSYNVYDVFLTKEIMLRKDLVNFFLNLCAFAGCGIEDALSTGRLVDSYMFHRLKGVAVQPSKEYREADKIQGGDVFPPKKGIYKNVIEVDNGAEYASLMRQFNMSPETLVDEDYEGEVYVLKSGNRYAKKPRGLFPRNLDELTELRQEKKDAQVAAQATGDHAAYQRYKDEERVVKELILTFYGVMASPHYRNSDRRIAGDITEMAREHLEWNRQHIRIWSEQHGYEWEDIAGDTDSCHGRWLDDPSYDETERRTDAVTAYLNSTYPEFLRRFGWTPEDGPVFISVKKEHVYEGYFHSGAAKRYACVYRDPKGDIKHGDYNYTMKVRGFELRRSNSAPITRSLQKESFKRILFGGNKEALTTYIQQLIKDLKEGRVPATECRIPTAITKEAYGKTKPIHVRAAEWSNQFLGKQFKAGDKPCMYFGTIRGLPKTDVFALEWNDAIPKDAVLDWTHITERTIIMPLRSIFDVLDIDPNDITQPSHKLDEFF